MRRGLFFTLLFLFSSPVGAADDVLSLKEAYASALQNSETLAIQTQNEKIAEAHRLQAWGTTLPHLDAAGSEKIQDSSSHTGSGGFTDFTRRSRPEISVGVSQPLFQGFREFQALKVAGAEKKEQSFNTTRARQVLFADVTLAYYTVLALESERSIWESAWDALRQRDKELADRARLGKTRETETLEVSSSMAATQAMLEEVKGKLKSARENLAFVAHVPVQVKLRDDFPLPQNDLPEAEIKNARADVLAADEAQKLARANVGYQRAGALPFLNVVSNYYPYRVGSQSNVDWDVVFNLSVPLWHGGENKGKIREAQAQYAQAKLRAGLATREATTQVKRAWAEFNGLREKWVHSTLSQRLAGQVYQRQLEDYRNGIVNNLDVLESLHLWQTRRLDASDAFYQAKLKLLEYKLALGELPPGNY